jgi:transposase-like protein
LAGEDIVRLILDGTVVRVRLDRKATNISLLVVLGVRRDGQKVLLAVKNMGGESEAAWRGIGVVQNPPFLGYTRRAETAGL